jgi:acyl carrier protein
MNTEALVRDFIVDDLHYDGLPGELTPEYPLLKKGVLDSLGLVTLVEHLEATCNIVIDEEDMVPENFGSIREIAQFVEQKSS